MNMSLLDWPWIEIVGITAMIFNLYAYFSKTMIPLRVAAIISNALFCIFAYYKGIYVNLALNMIVLPLNCIRLWEMRKLISDVTKAAKGDSSIDPLLPHMKARSYKTGDILFKKGDLAIEAYYLTSGSVQLVEIDQTLSAGDVLGEIGLFTSGNQRTMTAICTTDTELMFITYRDFETIYFQNPKFGFYMMRLIVQRMQANLDGRALRP
jgi:CRP/FNR family transcriptional regulator, cyclic AMP receptor protein